MTLSSPLLTVTQACEYLQICKAHFYSLLRSETDFPKPIRLGQTVRFRCSDFDKYVAEKVGTSSDVCREKRGRGRPRKTC